MVFRVGVRRVNLDVSDRPSYGVNSLVATELERALVTERTRTIRAAARITFPTVGHL